MQHNHGAIYDLSPREILYTAGVPAPESIKPYIDDPIDAAGEEPAEYPDTYYMLQAHILSACDRYEAMHGGDLKKRHMRDLTDALYNDITRIHPHLIGKKYDPSDDGGMQPVAAIPVQQFGGGGFRSRNFLRDLIEILFLSEFFRRRRRRY